jgi:bacterioferritin-associated ferredoxin
MSDKSPLLQRPDYLVCTCMGVMYSEIVDAIKKGAGTFEELSEQLLVGIGCNSCVEEIYQILKEEKAV